MSAPAVTTEMRRVLEAVKNERLRQQNLLAKGEIPWACDSPSISPGRKLSVLVEEIGEIANEINEGREDGPCLRMELIQVAAVAVAWAESL